MISDPHTVRINRQEVENAVNDIKSTLTEKEYEMMLTICRDWEENTNGEYHGYGSPNSKLKIENGKMAAIDVPRLGFQIPTSMIISGNEEGVKYIRGIIEPDTDSPYHERAEYGICYIYNDDPYKFVDADKFCSVIPDVQYPSYAQYINYLEKVYDDLYIYVIYSDPYA